MYFGRYFGKYCSASIIISYDSVRNFNLIFTKLCKSVLIILQAYIHTYICIHIHCITIFIDIQLNSIKFIINNVWRNEWMNKKKIKSRRNKISIFILKFLNRFFIEISFFHFCMFLLLLLPYSCYLCYFIQLLLLLLLLMLLCVFICNNFHLNW